MYDKLGYSEVPKRNYDKLKPVSYVKLTNCIHVSYFYK